MTLELSSGKFVKSKNSRKDRIIKTVYGKLKLNFIIPNIKKGIDAKVANVMNFFGSIFCVISKPLQIEAKNRSPIPSTLLPIIIKFPNACL